MLIVTQVMFASFRRWYKRVSASTVIRIRIRIRVTIRVSINAEIGIGDRLGLVVGLWHGYSWNGYGYS